MNESTVCKYVIKSKSVLVVHIHQSSEYLYTVHILHTYMCMFVPVKYVCMSVHVEEVSKYQIIN